MAARPLIDWDISTSPLKLLNGIQQNLTESTISMSTTKFVFFGPISKQKWPPWPVRQKVAHCTKMHDMWPFGPLVYALAWKVHRGHLVIVSSACLSVRLSVRPSICLPVIPTRLQTKSKWLRDFCHILTLLPPEACLVLLRLVNEWGWCGDSSRTSVPKIMASNHPTRAKKCQTTRHTTSVSDASVWTTKGDCFASLMTISVFTFRGNIDGTRTRFPMSIRRSSYYVKRYKVL